MDESGRKPKLFPVLLIGGFLIAAVIGGILLCPWLFRAAAYRNAESWMESGAYGRAASAFEALGEFRDAPQRKEECLAAEAQARTEQSYQNAVSLFSQGNFREAYVLFEALGDYRDSEEQRHACLRNLWGDERYEEWKRLLRWDTYSFGNYKGSTEWVVLEKSGTTLLLISRDCVDTVPYHNQQEAVTWNESSLRFWLNGAFLNEAFSEQERAMLCSQSLAADKNPLYSSGESEPVEDFVILFSYEEVKAYFPMDALMKARPSEQAVANGISQNDRGCSPWWLRTSGYYRDFACYVSPSGGANYLGDCVADAGYGVRPVIRIDLLKQGSK